MKEKFAYIFIIALSIIFYSLTIRGIAGNPSVNNIKNNLDQASKPFELSPERGRYILTVSLAENKSFSLSQSLADAAYPDVGYYQGKFYVYFPPGISLLAVPFYWLGKQVNLSQVTTFSLSSILACFTMLLLYKIARKILKLPSWAALASALVYGFASTSWSYAVTLYQHQLASFLLTGLFYCVWKFKRERKRPLIWASIIWLGIGYSIFADYSNAILMFPVIIYFLISSFSLRRYKRIITILFRKIFITSAIIFALMIFVHGFYNQVNFGSWRKTSGGLAGYKTLKDLNLLNSVNNENEIAKLSAQKNEVGFFREESLPRSFSILLFSRDRGLFLYCPVFITAIIGLVMAFKKPNREKEILLSIIGVNLFLYSSWGDPWGGWAYGPRYLIPSMAILSLFVGVWLHKTKARLIYRIITLVLICLSSAVALAGALTTNAVPPKIEADFLHMKYNFLLNIGYLHSGISGSFLYNTYIQKYVSLTVYYSAILLLFALVMAFVLFVLPNRLLNKKR